MVFPTALKKNIYIYVYIHIHFFKPEIFNNLLTFVMTISKIPHKLLIIIFVDRKRFMLFAHVDNHQ